MSATTTTAANTLCCCRLIELRVESIDKRSKRTSREEERYDDMFPAHQCIEIGRGNLGLPGI
jgi:hypothetical protein